jgi:hypothetical protein
MDQKNYIKSLQALRKPEEQKLPEENGLIKGIKSTDKFVIFQLDQGQMMHISPKVYYNFE